MFLNARYMSIFGCILLLSSCATVTEKRQFLNKKEVKEEINKASNYRASVISNSKTLYSDKIECLSKHINEINNMVVDKSLIGKYALIDPRLGLEAHLINNIKNDLEQKKKSLSEARMKLKKMDLKYVQMEKTGNLSEKSLDAMARISVSVKELEGEISSLKNEIVELETKISNYEQGLISPSGDYTSRKDFIQYSQGNASKIYSVSPIYDKTAKVFPADSTAISEMVAHALSYNNAIRYIDTPFNSSWEWSRAGKTNIQGNPSLGSVFPSDRYISGALVQYDEDLPILNNKFNSFRFSVDPLIINKNTQVITIGLTLRIADKTGSMHFLGFNNIDLKNPIVNSKNPNEINYRNLGMTDYSPSSVYLENTFFINNTGLDLFEITSNRNYGGSISIRTSDPKMYAVREMVERGVYELLLSTLPNKMLIGGGLEQVELNLRDKAKADCDIKPSDYDLKS